MIALLQKVDRASCTIDNTVFSSIGRGLLVFICAEKNDTPQEVTKLVNKTLNFRIFEDEAGKMNLSIKDISGNLLVVSQFTLAADTNSGNRPSFTPAASPDLGKKLYEQFILETKMSGLLVKTGVFGASMKIELINDGPATFWLQYPKQGK